MLDFLKKFFLIIKDTPPSFTGALLDLRPLSEKQNDIKFSDIVATTNVVKWEEKSSTRSFPVLDQRQSSTCGANALAKAMGIMFYNNFGTYLPFSRAHIYQRRANRPQAGMVLYDMFAIVAQGVTLEQLVPKVLYTDQDHDSTVIEPWMVKEGETWRITGAIYVPNNIETIASTIQTTGKGIVLLTYFLADEWSKEIPSIIDSSLQVRDLSALRHFVTVVDYTLLNGKKYLVIEDSAHFGGLSRRLLSTEWVNKRIFDGGYPMNFRFEKGVTPKPTFDGITNISAQECLRYLGYFPINVAFINNWGPISRQSIIKLQIANMLPQTGLLDTASKKVLHLLFP